MNTLLSFDWLSEYVDLEGVTPDAFAQRMSLSGPAVEKIYPQGLEQKGILVGRIVEINPHPNADKLRVVLVDIGSDKPAHIVCGGINLLVDQWVAVAQVGSMVRWHGEGEPVRLEPIEIRGVASEGMICAANEIGLFEAFPHADREILDLGKEIPELKVKPGAALGDVLGLSSDVVMDIEVTSNRVDCMGVVGMAREASAILGRKMLSDLSAKEAPMVAAVDKKSATVSVKIESKEDCLRFMAARISGVKVGSSPWWLKRRLLSAGIRPINVAVDISNLVMLELAQPMHVYDAAKLEGGLIARRGRTGEKMQALDGKMYELEPGVLVIADGKKPVAIAGVMGGEETGVTSATTEIVIEVATFDPVVVRRGARKVNLQSDAQLRFEKGLSTQSPPSAMARAIELILDLCGGQLVETADVGTSKYAPLKYSVGVDEVNALIGVPQSEKAMTDVLTRLGFDAKISGKKLSATVPWWRDHDIEDGRDLVEEIARVQGYENIPPVVPTGVAPRATEPELVWEARVREVSKGAGCVEVYSYSFISEDMARKAGFDPGRMLHVQNPLTSDYVVMRTTLLPSLLQVAADNQERAPEQRLFEVSNVYYSQGDGAWSDLPDEQLELGALFMGMAEPWRVAKGYVEHVLQSMGIVDVAWKRLSGDAFWHPGRTVQAFSHGKLLATVGEVSPTIAKAFKLEGSVGLVDMPLEKIVSLATRVVSYRPIPAFPEAKRDLAIVVDRHVEFDDIARAIRRTSELVSRVEWFDTYEGKGLAAGMKSVAMHLSFSAADRTLSSADVDGLMEQAVLAVKESFKADLRS